MSSETYRRAGGRITALSPAIAPLCRWAPAALAVTLVVLICLKAIMAADFDWDSQSYQLPFAALRVGLMSHWQFQRGPVDKDNLAAYYKGFPIFADLVRGWMWKLSGRPEAINLFGISVLVALVGYLRWAFRVSAAWAVIGLFAIPAIQTAAAGSYVDVPASAALAVFIFSICDLWLNPERFRRPARWVVMFVAAFAAANMKSQTSVFVCLVMPLVVPPTWRLLRQEGAGWPRIAAVWLALVASAMLIAYNLIRNLLRHGNPFWPVDFKLGKLVHFAGPVVQDAWLSPDRPFHWLPGPVEWLLSVLEFHSLDGRYTPYTNGMGNVPFGSPASGMGGFFAALVVASLGFFLLAARQRRDRISVIFCGVFLYLTVIVAFFPNAQNLRYDLFWMIFLVIGCLILLRGASLEAHAQSYRIVLVAALAFVTSVSGGRYFTPVRLPMQQYVDQSGAEQLLARIVKPGDVICLEQGPDHFDNRMTIEFAPIFHKALNAERPYAIREGYCDGYKTISGWR